MFLLNPYAFGNGSNLKLIDVLTSLGLTTNLKLCLDAGDSDSYAGTSQVWHDRSGGGYDFNRGATSSSEASDPTFNGVAGNQSSSEYFSFDGGDYFTLGQSNPTWVNNLHKSGAKFTVIAWVNLSGFASEQVLFGDFSNSGPNVAFAVQTTAKLSLSVNNESTAVYGFDGLTSVSASAWSMIGISIDEGAHSGVANVNSTQGTFSPAYSSPSTGSAGNVLKIGADGDATLNILNGGKMAGLFAWEGVALTGTQLAAIYDATKGKFGL